MCVVGCKYIKVLMEVWILLFFLAIGSHAIHSSHFVFIVVTMNVGHFGVELAGVGNYLLAQRRIQNTSKYLGWSIFSKQLMAFKWWVFFQNSSS